jgi:hypothetical protein
MVQQVKEVFSTEIEQAGREALKQFLTPPTPRPLSDTEQALLDRAILLSISFGTVNINAFCWGSGPEFLPR